MAAQPGPTDLLYTVVHCDRYASSEHSVQFSQSVRKSLINAIGPYAHRQMCPLFTGTLVVDYRQLLPICSIRYANAVFSLIDLSVQCRTAPFCTDCDQRHRSVQTVTSDTVSYSLARYVRTYRFRGQSVHRGTCCTPVVHRSTPTGMNSLCTSGLGEWEPGWFRPGSLVRSLVASSTVIHRLVQFINNWSTIGKYPV